MSHIVTGLDHNEIQQKMKLEEIEPNTFL